jgi:hypothetical protein
MTPSAHDDYYDDNHTAEYVAVRSCFPSSVVRGEIPGARAYRYGYYY